MQKHEQLKEMVRESFEEHKQVKSLLKEWKSWLMIVRSSRRC